VCRLRRWLRPLPLAPLPLQLPLRPPALIRRALLQPISRAKFPIWRHCRLACSMTTTEHALLFLSASLSRCFSWPPVSVVAAPHLMPFSFLPPSFHCSCRVQCCVEFALAWRTSPKALLRRLVLEARRDESLASRAQYASQSRVAAHKLMSQKFMLVCVIWIENSLLKTAGDALGPLLRRPHPCPWRRR
jgi:hypothetical protein